MALGTLSCATPTASGHLVTRVRAGLPAQWPKPAGLGEQGPLEITQGALSDVEAGQLGPLCRRAVKHALAPRGGSVEETAPAWRLVVSRLMVDTWKDPEGPRLVRARAVVEVRLGVKALAVGTGVAQVTGKFPSWRADGVEPGEVAAAVQAACQQATLSLLTPAPTPPAAALEQWRRAATATPKGSDASRLEALEQLARLMEPQDDPLFMDALQSSSPAQRRAACLGLGNSGATQAAAALAQLAETDADLAVRWEAVTSLNKLLAVAPGLKPLMRTQREAAAKVGITPTQPMVFSAESEDAEPAGDRVLLPEQASP